MRSAVLLVALSVLAAGCALREQEPQAPAPLPTLPAPAFRAPVPVSMEAPGAEPVIAVAADGTIYVEGVGDGGSSNLNKVFRSDDEGATWIDISPPQEGTEGSFDGYVAVADDGTVYAANTFALTLALFRSDDKGETWTRLPTPKVPATLHRHWILPSGASTLHVTVEALPPSYGPRLVGLPVDGPGTANEGMWYWRSDDRGTTWSVPVQIDPVVNFAGQGNMAMTSDGQGLYVPRYEEDAPVAEYTYDDGRWYLLASEDAGASWERREMFALAAELSTAVPSLAIDPAGTLHLAWSMTLDGRSVVHTARSADRGATWSAPRPLLEADGTHAMAWVVAEGVDEIALMWYEADAAGIAREVDADWHVGFARVAGAGTDAPATATARVTTEPVHRGNICAKGPACGPGEDRRLLDYPWMDVGPTGAVHLVFASTEWDRPSAYAVVAVER